MSQDEKQPQPAMDKLVQDSRIGSASRAIREGTAPEAVTWEQAQAVMDLLRAHQQRKGLTWKDISRSAGVQGHYLYRLNAGHRTPRWQELAMDLDRWLEDEAKREAAPKPTDFVMTRVAEEIFTVAEAAVTLKCIGLVHGPSGLGKTMALKAVAVEKPGSAFISVRTACTAPKGLLQSIGAALGLRNVSSESPRAMTRRLEELLIGTPRLIIIDEIHKLATGGDDKALHVLRDLYDATGAPMLWSGTTDLVAYLERGQARGHEPLAQIRRRIGIARNLAERADGGDGGGPDDGEPLYSVDEIRRVFARGKMRLAPEAVRYLWLLANLPDSGGLGTCRNLVVMATKVNESAAATLTEAMLRGVHRLLVSTRDYGLLQARMREQTQAAQAAAMAG